jgi:hypothetical protein
VTSEGITKAAAARALASSDPTVRSAAIGALGRQLGASATSALSQLVTNPLLAGDAASALARSPSSAAMAALQALGSAPATRRLAARAYFVRRWTRGERSEQLDSLLTELAASSDAGDRAVGVQALVAFHELPLAGSLRDPDARVRRAAALGALGEPISRTGAVLVARLAVEPDAATRQVLSIGLLDAVSARAVPTSTLVDRARAGLADAPLSALALARRASDAYDDDTNALFAARDPVLRAHFARGLGESLARSALGALARAYKWEADVAVRRAILESMARRDGDERQSPTRGEILRLAARLDPDRVARAVANRALDGRSFSGSAQGHDVAWIRLLTAEGTSIQGGTTAALMGSDGLARPIAFDDDGYALVPGISSGEARLRLAPLVPTYHAPPP